MSEQELPKSPVVEEVEAGKYAYCTCGKSAKGVHCDGSHKACGMRPEIVEIEKDGKVAWCACRKSGKGPFCDGTHAKL